MKIIFIVRNVSLKFLLKMKQIVKCSKDENRQSYSIQFSKFLLFFKNYI